MGAGALLAATVLVLVLAASPAHAASCSGVIRADGAFGFSCDAQIGGNPQGVLFEMLADDLASVSVASPAGISCQEQGGGDAVCYGPAVPPGTTVSGSAHYETPIEPFCSPQGEEPTPDTFVFGVESYPSHPAIANFSPSVSCLLGKAKLNKKKGTALLPVTVPGPGTLTLSGKGAVDQTLAPDRADTVNLLVKAKGKAKRKLKHAGKVKVEVKASFTPAGGTSTSQTKSITLRKKLGRS